MAQRRLRVAVVYGGRSGEHEVSIQSASSVLQAIDSAKYEAIPIAITHEGSWLAISPEALLAGAADHSGRLIPSADPQNPGLISLADAALPGPAPDGFDVAFPLVHGTFGEDGCLQGLFELAGVPYVGAGVLGSAVGMDKILMKAIFQANGFPVMEYVGLRRADWERDSKSVEAQVEAAVGFPCFVKPASLGSSVGITKVKSRADLGDALAHAAEFGSRLIAERAVDARELECGVLGHHDPAASVVGEVIPAREYYDYEAKYHDTSTRFEIPARVPEKVQTHIQVLAIRAFEAIGVSGMARVDFFLSRTDGAIHLNEINTIPGFTSMSVYPMLWAESGVSYPELIDRLIKIAIDRHQDESRNRTRYED